MPQHPSKLRKASRRRDKNKLANYGATLFHEVKRYDGNGNLIETVSPETLMARPIGATTKRKTIRNQGIYAARLAKTNGEGSNAAWSKVATAVKRGARVDYKKEKV
jgi:hypothetical protein